MATLSISLFCEPSVSARRFAIRHMDNNLPFRVFDEIRTVERDRP